MMLLVSISSVILGMAMASHSGAELECLPSGLLMLGVLLAHAGFNLHNSSYDVANGFAARSTVIPFQQPLIVDESVAPSIKRAARVMLSIALLIGGYFTYLTSYSLLLPIAFTLWVVFSYNGSLMRSPHMSLIMPGLVLGPALVVGSHAALTGEYGFNTLYVSIASFFLINNLYLLGQYSNYHLNRELGRFYFPMVYGTKRSSVVYVVFAMGVMYVIGMGDIIGLLPETASWAMLPIFFSLYAVIGAFKYGTNHEKLQPHLYGNIAAMLCVTLLLAGLVAFD